MSGTGSDGAAGQPAGETRAVAVPIVIILFNRPRETRQVWERIRAVRPGRLFVVADGPREGAPCDRGLCADARLIVETEIDWPCDVYRNYADTNMGCGRRVSTGLDWVFGHVDRAIILEDDCVPETDFFYFCEELLARYEDDERLFSVAGINHLKNGFGGGLSYYFSRYPYCWGWATWARAWGRFDFDLVNWRQALESGRAETLFEDRRVLAFWKSIAEEIWQGRLDTWAYRWALSSLVAGGLSAVASFSLVTNVGFGPGATHTKTRKGVRCAPVRPLAFPLCGPRTREADRAADRVTERRHFSAPGPFAKAVRWGGRLGQRAWRRSRRWAGRVWRSGFPKKSMAENR